MLSPSSIPLVDVQIEPRISPFRSVERLDQSGFSDSVFHPVLDEQIDHQDLQNHDDQRQRSEKQVGVQYDQHPPSLSDPRASAAPLFPDGSEGLPEGRTHLELMCARLQRMGYINGLIAARDVAMHYSFDELRFGSETGARTAEGIEFLISRLLDEARS